MVRDMLPLFRTGTRLSALVGRLSVGQESGELPGMRRDACRNVMDFLCGRCRNSSGKILALVGLRRTGKTTMMLHCIEDLVRGGVRPSEIAYVRIPDDMEGGRWRAQELLAAVSRLQDDGVGHFLVDEITSLADFEHCCGLADDLGRIGRIVVAGTDSCAFLMVQEHEMHDRLLLVRTTHIPFAEYVRLFPGTTIDGYMHSGGIFHGRVEDDPSDASAVRTERMSIFSGERDIEKYVNTAIVGNIWHALRIDASREHSMYPSMARLRNGLNEFRDVVQRVINDNKHRFLLSELTEAFRDSGWGALKRSVGCGTSDLEKELLNAFSEPDFLLEHERKLGILARNGSREIDSAEHVDAIRGFLSDVELFQEMPRLSLFLEKDGGLGVQEEETHLLSQPGMRWCQVESLARTFERHARFQANINPEGIPAVREHLKNIARGRLLEEIVLLETIRTAGRDVDVCQVEFRRRGKRGRSSVVGKIDMIVHDRGRDMCWCFEIKHSRKPARDQAAHLANMELRGAVERAFGRIAARAVLPLGEDGAFADVEGIAWHNVERYLIGIRSDGLLGHLEKERGRPNMFHDHMP